MRVRDVAMEPYFQRYLDTRPLAPARGELFTRPDSTQPTERFFSSLTAEEQARILAWLLDVAQDVFAASGVQSSINVDPTIIASERGRNGFLRLAANAKSPVTFEFGEVPEDWTVESANRLFAQIRDHGHQSALDNYGKGVPDPVMLHDLQFDTIKISGAVTIGIDKGSEGKDRMETLYLDITNAGKQHVVQGVESQATFQWLKEVGFTTFQGYWFGIPMPAAGITHKH